MEATKTTFLSIFIFVDVVFGKILQQEKFQPQVCNRTIQGHDLGSKDVSSKARCVAYCMQNDCSAVVFNATELKNLGKTKCVMKSEASSQNPYSVAMELDTCYMLRENIQSDFIMDARPTPTKVYGAVAKNLDICMLSSSLDEILILTDIGVFVYDDVYSVNSTPCAVTDFDWLWGGVYTNGPTIENVKAIFLNPMQNIIIIGADGDNTVWEFDYSGGGTVPSQVPVYPMPLYEYINDITQITAPPLPVSIEWAVEWAAPFTVRDSTEFWIYDSPASLHYYSYDENYYKEINDLGNEFLKMKTSMHTGTSVTINVNIFWMLPNNVDTVLWLPGSSCGDPSKVYCFAFITTDREWKVYKLTNNPSDGFYKPDVDSIDDFGQIVF